MTSQPVVAESKDRRQVFREYMKRFDPVAPARDAIEAGLVCEDSSRAQYRTLAARADLDVGCQQLLVGGIGSGKTTQLRLAERRLRDTTSALPVYVDFHAETDLSHARGGTLLAALGLRLEEVLPAKPDKQDMRAIEDIRQFATGYDYEPDGEDWRGNGLAHMPGLVKPKLPTMNYSVYRLSDAVGRLARIVSARGQDVVAIFDGLDRLGNPAQFWEVVEQDLQALKTLKISVIMTGPRSLMYGAGRQVKDYFDHVEYLSPATADASDAGLLMRILDARGARSLMDSAEMRELCLASGGVLRDLISLARSAGFSAYLDNEDRIGPNHVREAMAELGRTYRLSLGTKQLEVLRGVLAGTGFDPSKPGNLELLVNRQVLERESSYVVHPALARMLNA